jgi:hypothetical protein
MRSLPAICEGQKFSLKKKWRNGTLVANGNDADCHFTQTERGMPMSEHNRNETAKLARGAKWVIRQLLLEVETRQTEIELFDAVQDGHAISYRLLSGNEAVVDEFAQKLGILKNGNRLEVKHG